MDSSLGLGPVLANIILTEFEKLIVSDLVDSGLIKFYRRYVDDTLILVNLNLIISHFYSKSSTLFTKISNSRFTDSKMILFTS